MQRFIAIVILVVFVAGCATTTPKLAIEPSSVMKESAREKGIEGVKAAKRIEIVRKKREDYNLASTAADEYRDEIQRRADKYGWGQLSLTGAGILAGIAVVSLVAASPANAVWIAGLSGTSTGILSYQAYSESAGYSRLAWAKLYNEFNKNIAVKREKALIAVEKLWNKIDEPDDAKWDNLADAATTAVAQYTTVATTKTLPTGDDKTMKEVLEKLAEYLNSLKKEEEKPGGDT